MNEKTDVWENENGASRRGILPQASDLRDEGRVGAPYKEEMNMQQMPKKLVDAGKWLESVSHSWMYFNTVKKIISEAPTAEVYGQWIPIEERPPLVSDEYIVVIAGADKSTCLYYDADEGVWFDENEGGEITYKVEKWMPLPPVDVEPAEGENDGAI